MNTVSIYINGELFASPVNMKHNIETNPVEANHELTFIVNKYLYQKFDKAKDMLAAEVVVKHK